MKELQSDFDLMLKELKENNNSDKQYFKSEVQNMKKKAIMISVAIILLVLLFPIRNHLNDGGTVEYKALVYKISKVKRLISIEEMEQEGKIKEYKHGIIIEIFGFEIYNNVK